jgi:hypothetical protein
VCCIVLRFGLGVGLVFVVEVFGGGFLGRIKSESYDGFEIYGSIALLETLNA